MSVLFEGWLTKDGGALGSSKKRYCVLTVAAHGKTFMFDYYTDADKIEKKGTFLLARDCKFTKVGQTSFSIEVSSSGSRKSGSSVEFGAPTAEAFSLWEKAFVYAENPLKPSLSQTNDLMVIGASGYVGVATIKSLAKYKKDFTIFAGVRNLDSPKNAPLAIPGVTLVKADMNLPHTMVPAFTGVDCVFIVTPGDKERTGLSIAALKACKDAGVPHVIVLSFTSVSVPGTVFADQGIQIEDYVKNSGLNHTIVRLPLFMENVLGQLESIACKGEFYSPIPSNILYNAASVGDIGECIAKIMINAKQYAGMTLNLTGALCSEGHYAEAFSDALGLPVKHVQVPHKVTKEYALNLGMPDWQVDGWLELYKLIENKDPSQTSDMTDMTIILGRELTLPSGIAASVAKPLKDIREAFVKAEAEKKEAEKVAKEEAEKKKKADEEAKKIAKKAAYDAFMKSTSVSITGGSFQNKKLGTESSYKKRFIWVDYVTKTFYWSKTEGKEGASKSRELSGNSTTVEVIGDMVTIKTPGEKNIDLQVDDLAAWSTALKKCLVA